MLLLRLAYGTPLLEAVYETKRRLEAEQYLNHRPRPYFPGFFAFLFAMQPPLSKTVVYEQTLHFLLDLGCPRLPGHKSYVSQWILAVYPRWLQIYADNPPCHTIPSFLSWLEVVLIKLPRHYILSYLRRLGGDSQGPRYL